MEPAFPPAAGVEHRFVEVAATGLRMHVAEAGPADGPPVVLLHGWPQHWWCWRELFTPLADAGYHVIAPDLRGCGWTDAPPDGYEKEQLATDVLALLDELGVGSFQLVGHDWGGWTAQLIALRAPERVRKLTLINIAPVVAPTGAMLANSWRFLYQPLNAAPLIGNGWQRTRLMRLAYVGVKKRDRAVYADRMREPARARAGQLYYRSFVTKELLPALRGRYHRQHIQPPLMVLHGVRDPVIRPSMIEGFRALARDSTIHYVRGAGHFLADERPDFVSERLLGWLER